MGRVDVRGFWRHSWVRIASIGMILVTLLAVIVLRTVELSGHVAHAAPAVAGPNAVTPGDWPTYLQNSARQSYNSDETTLTVATAPHMKVHWVNQGGGQITSEPIEANGLMYWGSWDGLEHATNPTTGKDVWAVSLGQTSSCTVHPHGVLSSATVTNVTIGGVKKAVVFVGGGDVALHALDANTGATIWRTPIGSGAVGDFVYSSPALFNSSVYIGVSSYDDCPEVNGRIVQLNLTTGAIQHTFHMAPQGCIGGGTWGAPTIDQTTGMLYIATGDSGPCGSAEPYTSALLQLKATDLSYVGSWQVPIADQNANADFGNTPTLFKATINGVLHPMIGIANKNGYYYAWDRTNVAAGPLWKVRISPAGDDPARGMGSIASSSWDGTNLYVGSALTTVNGVSCAGSVRAVNPTNGTFLWEYCLGKTDLGSIISVPGLVVVGSGSSMYVLNAQTGKKLYVYQDMTSGAGFWGAASIAHGVLYIGNMDGKLYAFGL